MKSVYKIVGRYGINFDEVESRFWKDSTELFVPLCASYKVILFQIAQVFNLDLSRYIFADKPLSFFAEPKIIVTRHPAVVDWLKFRNYFEAQDEVRLNVTKDEIRGRIVIGNLPLKLAKLCDFYAIEFDGMPPRGTEYGLDEMVEAGVKLTRYDVKEINDV